MGFFQKLSGKTRCPSCGTMAAHPRDWEAESKEKEMIKMKKQMGFGNFQLENTDVIFNCTRCGNKFNLGDADSWEKTAKRVGENRAISEYNKLDQNNKFDSDNDIEDPF